MTTEEKKIEEAARIEVNKLFLPSVKPELAIAERLRYYDMWIEGAKSQVAKEYHTKGMYSEKEVKMLCANAWAAGANWKMADINEDRFDWENKEVMFPEWFEQNKKK